MDHELLTLTEMKACFRVLSCYVNASLMRPDVHATSAGTSTLRSLWGQTLLPCAPSAGSMSILP
jgi:hypothetical protein